MIKKIFDWFVLSSKNPANVSLTVKGLLPFLALLGIMDSQIMEETSNAVVEIIVQLGILASGIATLWGAVRKVYLSLKPKT